MRKLSDGTLIYPSRGTPPACPEGYEPMKGDPYIFIRTLKPCDLRTEKRIEKKCCGGGIKTTYHCAKQNDIEVTRGTCIKCQDALRSEIKTSLIITTFNRDGLLVKGLESIKRQNVNDLEIIVINDGRDSEITQQICKSANAKYLWTGQRHDLALKWRVPGFALNIGAKSAAGDILILSCAEMWHQSKDLIAKIIQPFINDPTIRAMVIPDGKDDVNGRYSQNLDKSIAYAELPKLNTRLPFLMAVRKSDYIAIGGYDEDFTGQSYDDNDFVDRMQLYGCHYIQVRAQCVHLYHERGIADKRDPGRLGYNRALYEQRKGKIIRNQGREWGVI